MFTPVRPGLCQSLPPFTVSDIPTAQRTSAETCLDANIVCSRAKNHYDPEDALNLSDEPANGADAQTTLGDFRNRFQPINPRQATRMYFS